MISSMSVKPVPGSEPPIPPGGAAIDDQESCRNFFANKENLFRTIVGICLTILFVVNVVNVFNGMDGKLCTWMSIGSCGLPALLFLGSLASPEDRKDKLVGMTLFVALSVIFILSATNTITPWTSSISYVGFVVGGPIVFWSLFTWGVGCKTVCCDRRY